MAPRFTVRSTTAADWQEVRALRLQALADTPIAFGETLAAGRRRDEASWRERGGRGQLEHSTFLAAIDADGTWVGTMGGTVEGTPAAPLPMLVGVFIAPSHRGRRIGVADALLAGVEEWAATEGDTITLDVHEDNDRAIAFYEARAYVRTGRTRPYPLAQGSRELEMRKAL
ncbi:GNAT family N-acetyltransferase [Curtobacterium sp. Leaf261]|uniref:GNAT family N-acetyltransferase n=1 Tax=Curtobacterium sp. Leaf261 TaxID=1736311 RepID=UPI0006F1E162|nr:GNAT family N-acetyltransferase [Curtobacterium sp. Leaf261]KQO60396.1 acetyltransferase [Curtobacterium sp. Leaf261]